MLVPRFQQAEPHLRGADELRRDVRNHGQIGEDFARIQNERLADRLEVFQHAPERAFVHLLCNLPVDELPVYEGLVFGKLLQIRQRLLVYGRNFPRKCVENAGTFDLYNWQQTFNAFDGSTWQNCEKCVVDRKSRKFVFPELNVARSQNLTGGQILARAHDKNALLLLGFGLHGLSG